MVDVHHHLARVEGFHLQIVAYLHEVAGFNRVVGHLLVVVVVHEVLEREFDGGVVGREEVQPVGRDVEGNAAEVEDVAIVGIAVIGTWCLEGCNCQPVVGIVPVVEGWCCEGLDASEPSALSVTIYGQVAHQPVVGNGVYALRRCKTKLRTFVQFFAVGSDNGATSGSTCRGLRNGSNKVDVLSESHTFFKALCLNLSYETPDIGCLPAIDERGAETIVQFGIGVRKATTYEAAKVASSTHRNACCAISKCVE